MADSKTKVTNIALLQNFLSYAKTAEIVKYTKEQADRLASILCCNVSDPEAFADLFPDADITAYRNRHGKPLHGGISMEFWTNHGLGGAAETLERQRAYISNRLLPNSRKKALEMFDGQWFHDHICDISPDTKEVLEQLTIALRIDQS